MIARPDPIFLILIGAAIALAAPAIAQEQPATDTCSACHTCDKPTADNLCLKKCMRPQSSEADKRFSESQSAPDVFVIDKISELYMPVVFPHRLHASMEAMSDGCKLCHHHETADKPQPCGACHGNATQAANLWQPSLRGAYHRQCLSCHRDWSGETGCIICHAERAPGQAVESQPDVTDITGKLHPNVQEPEKKIFQTPQLEEGTMVTFNHKDHVQLFGKRCVDCHAQENCSRCHNHNGDAPKHVRQDPHQDCEKCHDVAGDCTTCHMKTESPGFDHAKRSGFPLKAYHERVACRMCHRDPVAYKGLKRQCVACHAADWTPKEFDHVKSGKITLDDKHKDIDCTGCHPSGMGGPIKCDTCHDKDITYPEKLPGTPLVSEAPAKPALPAP